MSALIGKRHIAITAEGVQALGANNVIVLQQLWWWSTESRKANDDDTITITLAEMSVSTGLSKQAVHRALTWLREEGFVESTGEQKLTYRVTDKHLEIETVTVTKSGRNHSESGTVTVTKSGRLAEMATSNGEQTLENTENAPEFEHFWLSYPKRENGTRAGNKKLAKDAWLKLKPAEREAAVSSLPMYVQAKGRYVKDAERYLKHKLWDGLEVDGPGDRDARVMAKAEQMATEMGMR